MGELDKCPFCGDTAYKVYSGGQYGYFGYIECSLCGARTKTVKLIHPKFFKTEVEFFAQRAWEPAVRNWNRRRNGEEAQHDEAGVRTEAD